MTSLFWVLVGISAYFAISNFYLTGRLSHYLITSERTNEALVKVTTDMLKLIVSLPVDPPK